MAVRDRNHPDDVIVLKCPVCRNTQPLDYSDINSFPVNKKILERVSNGQRPTEDDVIGDDDLIEKFKHVSMETYENDADQTRVTVPYGAANGTRYQIELNSRSSHQNTIPRQYPSDPFIYSAGNDDVNQIQDYNQDEHLFNSMLSGQDEFDDKSYMDDVIQQLGMTDNPDVQNYRGEVADNAKDDDHDDVMAAIRRSCAEMYGAPNPAESSQDLVTDGPVEEDDGNPAWGRSNTSPDGAGDAQNDFSGNWNWLPGANGGMAGHPYADRNRHQRHWKKHHFYGQRGFLRGRYSRMFQGRTGFNQWAVNQNGVEYTDETEEDVMMKQLQKEADKNPIAADVLEEIVRVKSMKETERNGLTKNDTKRTTAKAELDLYPDGDQETNHDIMKELQKQVETNPAAAEIVRDMEMMEKLKDEGHLVPLEKQSVVEQVRLCNIIYVYLWTVDTICIETIFSPTNFFQIGEKRKLVC